MAAFTEEQLKKIKADAEGLGVNVNPEDIDPDADPVTEAIAERWYALRDSDNVLDNLAYEIHKFSKVVLALKRNLGKQISNLLAKEWTTSDIVVAISWVAGIAIVGAIVAAETPLISIVTQSLKNFEQGIGRLLAWLGADFWLSIHRFLLTLSEEYRVLWAGFHDAVQSLSAALGQDLNFLSMFLFNAEALVTSFAPLLGKNPDEMRVQFLLDAGEWVEKVYGNLQRYAADATLIIDDMLVNLILPYQEQYNNAVGALVLAVDTITGGVATIANGLNDVSKKLDQLIDDLPSEVFQSLQDQWEDVYTEVRAFFDEDFFPIFNKFDEAFDAIRELEQGQRRNIETEALYRRYPFEAWPMLSMLPEDQRSRQLAIFYAMSQAAIAEAGESSREEEIEALLGSLVEPPYPVYEGPDESQGEVIAAGPPLPAPPPINAQSWHEAVTRIGAEGAGKSMIPEGSD